MFSDSDSETKDLHTITINEHFAKAFEYRKEREELAKLEEKYGPDHSELGSSSSSEDSEDTEEDLDGEELTPAMDAAILRTLARIKKKDPAIYEAEARVFAEEHTRTQDKAPVAKPKMKGKSKPLTIRDAVLASALADLDSRSRSPSPRPLTHTEEQTLLRSETRAAFHGAINSETQGNDDDLLIPRSRTLDELELEEEEYKTFLEREVGEDLRNFVGVGTNEVVGTSEDVETEDGGEGLEGKKKKKGKKEREKQMQSNQENGVKKRGKKSKEEADQEFLINYIFNRGWMDRSNRRVPTYNEIVGSPSSHSKEKSAQSQGDSDVEQNLDDDEKEARDATLSDEETFDNLADAFETSYNFRFQEPGGALIPSFPRNLTSARRESTTRKDARSRKNERHEAEKQALLELRREEIRKERALVEAAVAEEDRNNSALPTEIDTSGKKKSRKQQRKEELARLKALKANELRRKLEMVSLEGGLGGIGDEGLAHLDLDADWDPSKHDAQMAGLYGDDDIIHDGDADKPVWDDDINIDDIVPPPNAKSKAELKKQRKKEKKKNKKVDKDEDVGVDEDEMDADLGVDDAWAWDDADEDWRGTEEERKRKVDAYMDEVVNKLGFSGITSHVPTRFHYTSVTSENYGLSPAEILLATDADLNTYVGLKKLAPYRGDRGGKGKKNWDPNRAERLKEFRDTLHSRVSSQNEGPWSLGRASTESRAAKTQGEKKKRKGKKERAKLRAIQDDGDEEGDDGEDITIQPEVAGKSLKRRQEPSQLPTSILGGPESDAEGCAPKKKRRRQHKKGSGAAGEREAVAML